MLVDDQPSEPLDTGGNPEGVTDWKNEFSRFCGSLIANPIEGWLCLRKNIVGLLLREQRSRHKTKDERRQQSTTAL
jgi:hypothetical protein